MGRYFGAALTDEVELEENAKQIINSLDQKVINQQTLDELIQFHGAELATMVLYQWLINQSKHSAFINRVNRLPAEKTLPNTDVKVIIIPALLYKEQPELGGAGELIVEVGEACGFNVEVLETDSRGSVSKNAQLIKNKIVEEECENIWLVALSKGAAEIRLFAQEHPDQLCKLRGIINLSGIFAGTPLANQKLSTPFHRLFNWSLCKLFGLSYSGLDELRRDHKFWQAPLETPDHLQLLHIVGVPTLSHVSTHLIKKYKKLLPNGPNDGMIYLRDVLEYPGHLYPVWGVDHLMRYQGLSKLCYKLFQYIDDDFKRGKDHA